MQIQLYRAAHLFNFDVSVENLCAAVAPVFTRKWQLHQQAADPPVTIHLVNQLQQLLLGDRAGPHHCVTGNTWRAHKHHTHTMLKM